jgi:hypothetical protein
MASKVMQTELARVPRITLGRQLNLDQRRSNYIKPSLALYMAVGRYTKHLDYDGAHVLMPGLMRDELPGEVIDFADVPEFSDLVITSDALDAGDFADEEIRMAELEDVSLEEYGQLGDDGDNDDDLEAKEGYDIPDAPGLDPNKIIIRISFREFQNVILRGALNRLRKFRLLVENYPYELSRSDAYVPSIDKSVHVNRFDTGSRVLEFKPMVIKYHVATRLLGNSIIDIFDNDIGREFPVYTSDFINTMFPKSIKNNFFKLDLIDKLPFTPEISDMLVIKRVR